ncbi:helix-turn-helix domain-containing protein [Phnomibacter ginsenosidimutans]|uniref:Helix-turn-helix domain-containing protein n=1 Tax=Phnomibacter ginsenosidimutans TaxID=2676868 RepID=A0A6I6GL04_9BACT|nr:helix-turn-helix transcriptional regulator [Phnomibacter ginsenosidimutans]QGW28318.1 helix-turn-helix domain-containing protein [Phnomibacter ginsenosidimutans]
MKREELLKSREYWIAQIQLKLYEMIENYRKENNLNKTQLAQRLGVTKGYITQILNGDFDHKVSKLVDLALAFDKVPCFEFENFEQYLLCDKLGMNDIKINARPIIHLTVSHSYTLPRKDTDTNADTGLFHSDQITYTLNKPGCITEVPALN